MDSPFHPVTRVRPTLLQRLFGRQPPANALVTLIDRLRTADSVQAVRDAELDALGREYRIDIRTTFHHDLTGLYREYLVYCLTDRHLSNDELADLEHLRSLFSLDAAAIDAVHRTVARQLYLKSVDEVLADGAVSSEERAFLQRLRKDLAIPEAIADNMLDVKRSQLEAKSRKSRK
jgi:hypothetical protein